LTTYAQNPRFSKLTTYCGLVAHLLSTRQTILIYQDIANNFATNWQQVVVMEFA